MNDDHIRAGDRPPPPAHGKDGITERLPPAVPPSGIDGDADVIRAELVHRAWLRRQFVVHVPEGKAHVEYYGRGIGFESVFVDGFTVRSETSFLWFVPEFRFRVGRRRGVIKVRVWPWLTLRTLELWVDDCLLYREGVGRA